MKRLFLITTIVPSLGAGYYLYSNIKHPDPIGPPYQMLPKVPYDQHPNKHIISKTPKTIGIIGAGISGLIGAKTLKTQGYEIEVIEKNPGPGGVWYKNYDNCGLQAPKNTYHIPDYPIPDNYDAFPKQPKLKEWIENMVHHFDLKPLCMFNTEVKQVTQNSDETWKVDFSNGTSKNYDFLIIAAGLYNIPFIPKIPGAEKFKGKILHSTQFINAKKFCEAKKVVIVGGGKGAFDIMNTSSEYGADVTGIVRHMDYTYPTESKPYNIPILWTSFSRFIWTFGIIHDPENSFIHKYLYPIEFLLLKIIGLQFDYKLIKELEPDKKVLHVRETAGVREDITQENIKNKKIKLVRGSIDEINENGVTVKGKFIEADTIIFATGFTPDYLIDSTHKDDGLWTYRHILIPGLRNIATLGCFIVLCNPLWNSIQACWLNDVLRGHVKCASVEEMKEDIKTRKKQVLDYYPLYADRAIYRSAQSFSPFYIDTMLKEMGISPIRESTMLKHWMNGTDPLKYKSVITHHI